MVFRLFKILGILLASLFVVAITLAVMLPPVTRGREGARRTQCQHNLKQIQSALLAYESRYHALPPAHTVDANGHPLHSWRTLLLPYLDEQELFETIDLSKPWDDPANQKAHDSHVGAFICPSTHSLWDEDKDQNAPKLTKTTYMAVLASNSCFRSREPRKLSEIEDRHEDTMLIIEAPPESAVHWMAPMDIDEKTALNLQADLQRPHATGTHAVMVDGTVRFLNFNLPQDTIRALISIAGHESVGEF